MPGLPVQTNQARTLDRRTLDIRTLSVTIYLTRVCLSGESRSFCQDSVFQDLTDRLLTERPTFARQTNSCQTNSSCAFYFPPKALQQSNFCSIEHVDDLQPHESKSGPWTLVVKSWLADSTQAAQSLQYQWLATAV